MGHGLAAQLYLVIGAGLLLTLSSCNLFRDPSLTGAAPRSPAKEWHGQEIELPKHITTHPYTAEDLSSQMSVSQLLDIALYNNPATKVSWQTARAAAYAYRASLSLYYPTLNYTGVLTAEKSGVGGGVNNAFGTSVVANQAGLPTTGASAGDNEFYTLFNEVQLNHLLFDFGGRQAQTRLALETLHAANWQHNLAMQQVMVNVLSTYASYIGNKGLVAADELNLKDAEVALKATQAMRNAGLSTLTDVLSAQTAVAQARFNLEQAKGAEKTSLGQLLVILGLPADTPLGTQDIPDHLPVIELETDLCGLLELAKKRRPDIGAAIAAVKEQQAQLAISKSAGAPTATLNGIWSRTHFIRNANLDGNNNSASLTVNFPLFQGFFYYNQQKQLKSQIKEALANLDVQLSQVATTVVTDYYAFTTAAASLPSAEAAVDSSERAYRGFLAQYKVGTASIVDMLTALTTLSTARGQLVLTRTQWAASLANLAFAVGILEDTSASWQATPPEKQIKKDTHES